MCKERLRHVSREPNQFARWLNATMQSRGLSQAELARAMGVADTQVSRWRRGQVVPTVRYLQKMAETLDVPRSSLDRLAGYPVSDGNDKDEAADPQRQAELQTYQVQLRLAMDQKIPRRLWKAYTEACEALGEAMSGSYLEALEKGSEARTAGAKAQPDAAQSPSRRQVGFRP
jgi:transcriptional regulator with XRE-family HTH domain